MGWSRVHLDEDHRWSPDPGPNRVPDKLQLALEPGFGSNIRMAKPAKFGARRIQPAGFRWRRNHRDIKIQPFDGIVSSPDRPQMERASWGSMVAQRIDPDDLTQFRQLLR